LAGPKGNTASSGAWIAADGRFVAFDSLATTLDPADGDLAPDVFVRDLQTNTTSLVSRAGGAGAKGDGASSQPSISADGRFVAFESVSSNLAAPDGDTSEPAFFRDLQPHPTTPLRPT